ncbi:MAG: flagellar protein FliT [Sphaerobacter sp.]|nr:flagellar protein FliT [Sphaerobacter sp.]
MTTPDATTRIPLDAALADLLALARDQAQAARLGDWEAVNRLADQRASLTTRLQGAAVLPSPEPDPDASTRIATLVAEIRAADAEVIAHAQREIERVARELDQIRHGRAAARAYGRDASAARQDLVCRYG